MTDWNFYFQTLTLILNILMFQVGKLKQQAKVL